MADWNLFPDKYRIFNGKHEIILECNDNSPIENYSRAHSIKIPLIALNDERRMLFMYLLNEENQNRDQAIFNQKYGGRKIGNCYTFFASSDLQGSTGKIGEILEIPSVMAGINYVMGGRHYMSFTFSERFMQDINNFISGLLDDEKFRVWKLKEISFMEYITSLENMEIDRVEFSLDNYDLNIGEEYLAILKFPSLGRVPFFMVYHEGSTVPPDAEKIDDNSYEVEISDELVMQFNSKKGAILPLIYFGIEKKDRVLKFTFLIHRVYQSYLLKIIGNIPVNFKNVKIYELNIFPLG